MKLKLSLFFILLLTISANAQTSKIVSVTSAGTLSTLVDISERQLITDLVISGNLDARDFKFIRDEMPLTENINISEVSIKSYSGTGGTFPSSEIMSYPGNGLPSNAFYNGVTTIPKTSLKSIILPQTLQSIGNNAFYNCDGLTNLIVPNSVNSIGNFAFQQCDGLTDINLGSGITSIGDQCFYDCTKLKVVTINSLTPPSYGGQAFFGWTSLSIVYVPTASLSQYKSTLYWKDLPLASNEIITVNNPTAGGIKASLNAIGVSSLSTISKLVVTGNLNSTDFDVLRTEIPLLFELDISGATLVGNTLPANALNGKSTLRKLKLPSSLGSIDGNALYNCTNLTDILPLPESLTTIGYKAFENCKSIKGELLLPNTLTTISSSAFKSCSGLTGSLNIPNLVTTLGASAFQGCSGFNGTLTLPASITVINNSTFAGCINLTGTLIIPESVTSIEFSAFYDCKMISDLVIGSNCSTLGDEAFQNALNLNRITITNPIPPTITSSTFGEVPKTTCTLFVPSSSIGNYKAADYWKAFSNISPISANGTYNVTLQIGVGGNVSVNSLSYANGSIIYIEKDATVNFNITPNPGYEIATLTFDGIDVLDQINNGLYTSPAVTANTILSVTFRKVTYKIFVSIGEGGVVKENNVMLTTGTELITDKNATRTFTILPSEGYVLDTLRFGSEDVKLQLVNNQYSTGPLMSNDTLKVRFIPSTLTYGITVKIGENGSVKENNDVIGNDAVVTTNINGTKTFTFIPSTGYELATASFGGVDIKSKISNGQFTTQPITSDIILSVTFIKITYNITVQIGVGGEVKENDISLANGSIIPTDANATRTFTFVPSAGYELGTVTYGGLDVKSQVSNNQFTTQAITANMILSVSFRKLTFSITVQIGSGGEIKENNINLTNGSIISADINTTKTFTFIPSTGYELATVTYGGTDVKSQLSGNQFTTPSITANSTLNVTFRLIVVTEKYGLTFLIGDGGKITSGDLFITSNSILDLNKGSVRTFTFVPDAGYEIFTLTYDGVNVKSQIINNEFTIPPLNANTTLNVTFRLIQTIKTYDITMQIGNGGVVRENGQLLTNNTVLNVEEDSIRKFTFIPEQGYVVETLTYGGLDQITQLENNTYTTTPINSNATLSVTFKKIQYKLTIKDAAAGVINLICDYGSTPTFSIVPAESWKVNTVVYNNTDVTANLLEGVYTLPPVTANGSLNISFVNLTASPIIGISNVKVYTDRSDIVIEGISADEQISVYTVNGSRVYNLKSSGERTIIPARPNAVYLVKTAGKTYKVIL